MKWLLPSPALSFALFLLWILLMQSVSAGTILLGVGLALFWPMVGTRLGIAPLQPRRPLVMAALLVRVLVDMLRSNGQVAWALLTRRADDFRSGFVRIPLELRDPHGLAVLATIVTFTPGTVWALLSLDKRILLLHVFRLDDEELIVTNIKHRYERPLREIFE